LDSFVTVACPIHVLKTRTLTRNARLIDFILNDFTSVNLKKKAGILSLTLTGW